MTTRTELAMQKQLAFAHGWIAWLSLGSTVIWGGLAAWEYRDYQRAR